MNPSDCSCACPVPTTVNVPGTQGESAFTFTNGTFVVPPLGNQVTVTVLDTNWMAVGQTIFIATAGTFIVNNINSLTSVLLTYENISANTASGNTIATNSEVTPSGVPGSDGANAFTVVASPGFTVPALNGSASVPVASSAWISIGQEVFVQGAGYFLVTATADNTHFTGTYSNVPQNTNATASIPAGNTVSPAGPAIQAYQLFDFVYIQQGTVSYTPSANCRALYVECIGGAGSGGGGASTASDASCGSGGGGGAYSAVFLTSLKGSYTVQVGAGGAAPSAGNNPGNPGTDTTFDSPSVCTAKAGAAGAGGGAAGTSVLIQAGGAGGASSGGVGDIKFDGTGGGYSTRLSGTIAVSGDGAPGPWGGGQPGVAAQGNGVTGGNYGAGGSGGATINGGATTAGGAGSSGLIRVWELK